MGYETVTLPVFNHRNDTLFMVLLIFLHSYKKTFLPMLKTSSTHRLEDIE